MRRALPHCGGRHRAGIELPTTKLIGLPIGIPTKICAARRAFQAAASLQPNKIATETGRARTDRHAHQGVSEKANLPAALADAILASRTAVALGTRRPKISASRTRS